MRHRFAALFLAALAWLGAGGSESHADVTIALAAPFTGPRAATGEDMRRAAEAAVGVLNAEGGLLGERVRLSIENDGCERDAAAALAHAVARRAPAVVVGHPCSSAAIAAASGYAAEGLLFIAAGARHPGLTTPRAGPTIFRLAGRDDRQGAAAADWLRSIKGERFALIHDRTVYARRLAEDAAHALLDLSPENVTTLPIVVGRNDYGEIAARIEAEKIDALFFAGYPAEATLVLRAARRSGRRVRFLGSDSLATPEFGAAIARDHEHVRVLLPDDVAPPPDWHSVQIASTETEPHGLRTMARLTQAAVEAWAGAVRRSGSFAADRVSAALRDGTVTTTALGPLSFGAGGDARLSSYEVGRWDGKLWIAGNEP